MDELKHVSLTEEGAFLLYRAIVCETLDRMGFVQDAWDFSSCLDGSFEEIKGECISTWPEKIQADADEYKLECPGDFRTLH